MTGGLAADEGLDAALREAAVDQKAPLDVVAHPDAVHARRGDRGGAVGRVPREEAGGARHRLDLRERAA